VSDARRRHDGASASHVVNSWSRDAAVTSPNRYAADEDDEYEDDYYDYYNSDVIVDGRHVTPHVHVGQGRRRRPGSKGHGEEVEQSLSQSGGGWREVDKTTANSNAAEYSSWRRRLAVVAIATTAAAAAVTVNTVRAVRQIQQ